MRTQSLRPALESPGPYATALVDVAHDSENGAQEHALRVRAACDGLAEQGASDKVVERVRERLSEQLHRPAPVARLVVATEDDVLVDEVAGFQVDHPVATYDLLPDLGTWIGHRDSSVTFVLALVDHRGGDVAVYDSDVPEPAQESSVSGVDDPHIHKVPVGGWSALRYQHHTENVWKENAESVVEEVLGQVRSGQRLVLLAGDPYSRGVVRDSLADAQAEVIELESGTRNEDGGDQALQQAIREALMGVVVRRRVELLDELAEELGRGGAAVAGAADVADALVKRQVRTLRFDAARLPDERLDPADHVGLPLPSGLPDGELRADLVLVAAAVLTDADVSPAPATSLHGEPVAALLRWEERPGNAPPPDEV